MFIKREHLGHLAITMHHQETTVDAASNDIYRGMDISPVS